MMNNSFNKLENILAKVSEVGKTEKSSFSYNSDPHSVTGTSVQPCKKLYRGQICDFAQTCDLNQHHCHSRYHGPLDCFN